MTFYLQSSGLRVPNLPGTSSEKFSSLSSISCCWVTFSAFVKGVTHRSKGKRGYGRRDLRICCEKQAVESVAEKFNFGEQQSGENSRKLSCVMKFGGSSVATAARMKEVALLILSFPEEDPVIVMSAMGKTTNKLLEAGERAVSCGVNNVSAIDQLHFVKNLHIKTVDVLGVPRATISELLEEFEQLLTGISLMKELTPRTRDYLVSFGERMSTRIFAAYLNKIGHKARQYDAFDIGFMTTDEFTNADILEVTYPAVAQRLHGDWSNDPAMPIVTGFLGKGWKSGAVTTLGRGGSDLTATAIGKALGLREIQVWKDVDGVLTCDPNIYPRAEPVPFLTFEEAAELAYFGAQVLHPQSMRPARESDIPVRVKNSYNPKAPGTLITKTRDMNRALLTSIVLKRNVTMLDIVSTRMLGHYGFLAKVFSIFEDLGISVDVVATSETSISLTLDPCKLWSRELIQQELDHVVLELEKIAVVHLLQNRSIISLIGNVQLSALILEKVETLCKLFQPIGSKVHSSAPPTLHVREPIPLYPAPTTQRYHVENKRSAMAGAQPPIYRQYPVTSRQQLRGPLPPRSPPRISRYPVVEVDRDGHPVSALERDQYWPVVQDHRYLAPIPASEMVPRDRLLHDREYPVIPPDREMAPYLGHDDPVYISRHSGGTHLPVAFEQPRYPVAAYGEAGTQRAVAYDVHSSVGSPYREVVRVYGVDPRTEIASVPVSSRYSFAGSVPVYR